MAAERLIWVIIIVITPGMTVIDTVVVIVVGVAHGTTFPLVPTIHPTLLLLTAREPIFITLDLVGNVVVATSAGLGKGYDANGAVVMVVIVAGIV